MAFQRRKEGRVYLYRLMGPEGESITVEKSKQEARDHIFNYNTKQRVRTGGGERNRMQG